jgi:hypothetical protein
MPDEAGFPVGHIRLQDVPRFTGREIDSFKLIVAPVRDPWEQQVSQAAYWATRYLEGSRHVHDVSTWRHVSEMIVHEDIMRCAMSCERFSWQPRHINMTGFVDDMRCDFRSWYAQHHGAGVKDYEQEDYYRWWLTYNGEIPDTVRLVGVGCFNTHLPQLLQPFAEHELPRLKQLNTSSHQDSVMLFYTSLAVDAIHTKFAWYFAEGQRQRWQPE